MPLLQPQSPLHALTSALSDAQSLLTGPEGRRRWRSLALAAAAGGIVGAGLQPPPLGLLQPVWEDPTSRAQTLQLLRGRELLLVLLAGAALACVALSRSFTFSFAAQLAGRMPGVEGPRPYLKQGAAHFVWSAAISIPLYAALFWAEGTVAGQAWDRLLTAPNEQLAAVALAGAARFMLVLLPWIVLTLPAMVLQYELTPMMMVREQLGPRQACARILDEARSRPGEFAGYLAVRLFLQVLGTGAAGLVLLPCAAAAVMAGAPLLAAGWLGVTAAGGLHTAGGVLSASVAGGLWLALLYCFLCAALVPVSTLLFLFAGQTLFPGEGAVGAPPAEKRA